MFSDHVISVNILCSNIVSLNSLCDYFKMGKITLEMLAKSPSHTKKRRDETVQQYARRLTHLYFSEKNIDEIVSRSVCSSDCSIGLDRSVNLVVCTPSIHFVDYAPSYSYSKLLLSISVDGLAYKYCSVSLQHSITVQQTTTSYFTLNCWKNCFEDKSFQYCEEILKINPFPGFDTE